MTDEVSMSEQSRVTASTMLVAARESLNLSQEDVARELYLTPAFIRYIDEDRIDDISKQAFVKGYLRSYAKLVKLDADEVVLLFEADSKPPSRSSDFRKATNDVVSPRYFTGPVFQTGVLGLVGLLIVVVMVWFYSSSNEQAPSDSTPQESAPQESAPQEESSAVTNAANETAIAANGLGDSVDEDPLADGADTHNNLTVLGTDDSSLSGGASGTGTEYSSEDSLEADTEGVISEQVDNTASTETNVPVIEIDPELVSVERKVEEGINYISVEAGGEETLRFVFVDECWLEIKDGNGNAIYADLGRSGDEVMVFGTAPFEVLFGKAPAVTMEFNGRYVDLERRTASDDTAKVRVGI